MDHFELFGITDVGMEREHNEDSFWIKDFGNVVVALVADGMGGHVGGKIASSTVVETVKNYLELHQDKAEADDLIQQSMVLSDSKIREISKEKFGDNAMGTTCTMAVITREEKEGYVFGGFPIGDKKNSSANESECLEIAFGHVGDSKLYLIRENQAIQKTSDHTLMQRMLDSGSLQPEEVDDFAYKNVIYKALGSKEELDLESIETFTLIHGDVVLLCSDGLSNYVKSEEMVNILKETVNIKDACVDMVNLAKHRGGKDNITVIIGEYETFKRELPVSSGDITQVIKRFKREFLVKIDRKGAILFFSVLSLFIISLILWVL